MSWMEPLRKTPAPQRRVWASSDEIITTWADALEHKGSAQSVLEHYPKEAKAFARLWGSTLLTQLEAHDVETAIQRLEGKCKHLRGADPKCNVGLAVQSCPLLTGAAPQSCPRYAPLDPTGVRSYLRTMNALYEWLLMEGHVAVNPIAGPRASFEQRHRELFAERSRNARTRELTMPDVKRIVLESPVQHGTPYLVQAKCFVRMHEVLKLDMVPGMWNLEQGWAEIPRNRAMGGKRLGNHRIIFDRELKTWLTDRYLPWRDDHVQRDDDGKPVTTRFAITQRGLPWGKGWRGNYRTTLHKNAKRIGLMTGREKKREERFNSHCFRGFSTTYALGTGINDLELKILRGEKYRGTATLMP
ncbi:MAG: hypothetical protein V4510_05735 [bacterium]